jgi:NAD-dependent SIR2 family protein deacetylase
MEPIRKNFCSRCKHVFTDEEKQAVPETENMWLCKDCDVIIKKNIEKWQDKFQQMKF